MSLHSQIKESLKDAMRAKDETKLLTLRGLISAFGNELLTAPEGVTEVSDESALTIIKRQVKQHKDAIEQFKTGGRDDLVNAETAELTILEEYLPELMSEDQIKAVIEKKKTELGITNKAEMGKLMGAVVKELKGQADGAVVKKLAEELLA
jgi:hypothetical protein